MTDSLDEKIIELKRKVKRENIRVFVILGFVLLLGVLFFIFFAVTEFEFFGWVGTILILVMLPCLCGSDAINIFKTGEEHLIELKKLESKKAMMHIENKNYVNVTRKDPQQPVSNFEKLHQKEITANYERCPYCNTYNKKDQNYCEKCGKDLIISTLKYCSICGFILSDEDKCVKCDTTEVKSELKIVILDSISRYCTLCGKKIYIESEFCSDCAKTVPLIYVEDVDENFDNKTGQYSKQEVNFCVCCGELIVEAQSVCKNCDNAYFKGLDAVYSSEFVRTIKKVQPPIIKKSHHGGKYLFKIIIAGSDECGRTTLLRDYTTGQFNSDTKMTIGVDFAMHHLELPDNQGMATLQIWDFGSEERFRTMLPSFCQGASGAFLFFDLLRTHTFYELDEWINIIRRNSRDIPIVLVGTKYDLIENPSDLNIDPQQVMSFIQYNKINGYISISTKTGFNVNECFEKLTKLMIKSK